MSNKILRASARSSFAPVFYFFPTFAPNPRFLKHYLSSTISSSCSEICSRSLGMHMIRHKLRNNFSNASALLASTCSFIFLSSLFSISFKEKSSSLLAVTSFLTNFRIRLWCDAIYSVSSDCLSVELTIELTFLSHKVPSDRMPLLPPSIFNF